MITSSSLGQGTCKESVGASADWLKLLSQSLPVSPARTRAMLSALFGDQQHSQPRQKVRGKLKSVRATSGASRPLARTAGTPDSKVSGPLAATARTPDSKVTRQQASSKQCAGKRAASRGARADAKRARVPTSHGRGLVAQGAEGACRETDEEHWQRHSCQPRAHLCCRCNFIKRKMMIERDFPWCEPRPQFMGGPGRLGCHTCSWVIANLPGEMPEEEVRRGECC